MALMMFGALYVAVRYARPMSGEALHLQQGEGKNGRKVAVDSGHGGIDSGKIGVNGSHEKDINLAIGYKLKALLEDAGYEVVMTRTGDAGLYQESDSNKKAADMKNRCRIIEEGKVDLVISIHQNSYSSSTARGAQMFYYAKSEEGKKLAQILTQSFLEGVDGSNHRVAKSNNNYYMLLHTACPTVIAECGFLSNWEEATLLGDEKYQEKIARALFSGIETYYNQK